MVLQAETFQEKHQKRVGQLEEEHQVALGQVRAYKKQAENVRRELDEEKRRSTDLQQQVCEQEQMIAEVTKQ